MSGDQDGGGELLGGLGEGVLPNWAFGTLLAVAFSCALHAVWDLRWPSEVDIWREMGRAYAVSDGNFLADHSYPGELRPSLPLLPGLMALLSRISGVEVHLLYARGGPFLNLLGPIAFYLFVRRMFDGRVALAAATGMLVMGGSDLGAWLRAAYSTWMLPHVTTAGVFFLALWSHANSTGLRAPLHRLLITGVLCGLTYLLRSVPALLLGLTFGTLGVLELRAEHGRGESLRSLLVLIGSALVVALPTLWLLFRAYGLREVNSSEAEWHGIPIREAVRDVLTLRGALALLGASLLVRARGRRWLAQPSQRMLLAFLTTLVITVGYAVLCKLADRLGVALPFPVAGWGLYQYAKFLELLLMGVGLVGLVDWLSERFSVRFGSPEQRVVAGVVGLFALHLPFHLTRHEHVHHRKTALELSQETEIPELHRWIRTHVPPGAVVLAEEYLGLYGVAGAGRGVVALPPLHANPYVHHEPREAAREQMLEALARCDLPRFLELADQYQVTHAAITSPACLTSTPALRELVRLGEISVWARGDLP